MFWIATPLALQALEDYLLGKNEPQCSRLCAVTDEFLSTTARSASGLPPSATAAGLAGQAKPGATGADSAAGRGKPGARRAKQGAGRPDSGAVDCPREGDRSQEGC